MQSYKSKSQVSYQFDFLKRVIIRISLSLALSFVIVFSSKFFFFFPFTLTNDFMAPEYKKGSRVYITYLFQKDKLLIGDVILVKMESSQVLLARIAGRKGDRVYIKNKKLYRNGNPISETGKVLFTDKRSPFSETFSKRDNLGEILVKEKSYFLLADNRDDGVDSREVGLISQDSIIGKLVF